MQKLMWCLADPQPEKIKQNRMGTLAWYFFGFLCIHAGRSAAAPGAVMHQSTHNTKNSLKPFRGKGDSWVVSPGERSQGC